VATAEVIALLGLKPVFVDVDERTFAIDVDQIENKITSKTVAIVPVHLFGQCAPMEPLLALAKKHNLSLLKTLPRLSVRFIRCLVGFQRKQAPWVRLDALHFSHPRIWDVMATESDPDRDKTLADRIRMDCQSRATGEVPS